MWGHTPWTSQTAAYIFPEEVDQSNAFMEIEPCILNLCELRKEILVGAPNTLHTWSRSKPNFSLSYAKASAALGSLASSNKEGHSCFSCESEPQSSQFWSSSSPVEDEHAEQSSSLLPRSCAGLASVGVLLMVERGHDAEWFPSSSNLGLIVPMPRPRDAVDKIPIQDLVEYSRKCRTYITRYTPLKSSQNTSKFRKHRIFCWLVSLPSFVK